MTAKEKVVNKTNLVITAKTADRYTLYQQSVQSAEFEIDFFHRVFKKYHARTAISLREDFCGTGLLSTAWVASRKDRTAVGVDIDPHVLAWGSTHNVQPLGTAAARVTLLQQDVRTRSNRRFDVINAMNFSYWVFMTRAELHNYFVSVRRSLVADGVFFLDLYGGWDAQQPMSTRRKVQGRFVGPSGVHFKDSFTYLWEQASFDPITHRIVNHIHFAFRDGSQLRRAFTYDWRFWTLPEIQEILRAAGFSEVIVHWEKGQIYRPATRADNQPGWLAFLAALV